MKVATTNATFCATLADEWASSGVTAAFVSPGSRSTPLALALYAQDEIAVTVLLDERTASFAALGHGLATGTPAVVLCSSGTAATHFHAAAVEADLSCVPILICTADRPPSLWARGAPQTINQTSLFGGVVRAFLEPGLPHESEDGQWRHLAQFALQTAMGQSTSELDLRTANQPLLIESNRAFRDPSAEDHSAEQSAPGPVHLNLSFDEPLTGEPGPLPPRARTPDTPRVPRSIHQNIEELASRLIGRTGVIIAGRGPSSGGDITALGQRLGWPIISDHRSRCRRPGALQHADSILRSSAFASSTTPQVILRFGEIVSSKSVSLWIKAASLRGSDVIATRPWGRLVDPEATASHFPYDCGLAKDLLAILEGCEPSEQAFHFASLWLAADNVAKAEIEQLLADRESEPAIARHALAAVPTNGALMLSSSMPVRDVEWYGQHRSDIQVHANRGANGIDGILSTSIGIASSGLPTVCLIGDVAFLHDSTALIGLARRPIDLTVLVINNDGGGIFSFLPQRSLVSEPCFEDLFGTPHATDLVNLAAAHGLVVDPYRGDQTELRPHGVRIVVARTNRDKNLAKHNAINDAVDQLLTPAVHGQDLVSTGDPSDET